MTLLSAIATTYHCPLRSLPAGPTESSELAKNSNTGLAVGAAVAVAGAAAIVAVNAARNASSASAPSAAEAARFLSQCTFGVTDGDLAAVQSRGIAGWISDQMAMAPFSMLAEVRQRIATQTPYRVEAHGAFVESFWRGALTRPDQLRQRMQFALSQIFVVTRENETLEFDASLATTNFYDTLGANAFKNWRDLIEILTLNPIMAVFLSYITNDKEDPASGRNPDENYAREIMQLFSIGTILLNPDGTPQLDANGATIPTYSHDDIAGLAKVFTGISWFSPSGPNENSWLSSAFSFFDQGGENGKPSPTTYYPKHHSISEKKFLGVTIPAQTPTTANPAGDVKIALDTLFHHQNTAPYFAKRLIQQFVTSNPKPAYVARVAAVFADNGNGVRGDMGAVLTAVLTDNEARDPTIAQGDPNWGKLREPMIRVTNWGRSFGAVTKRGHYSIGETGNASVLSQGILDAPSVFNFWRAGYVPPHTLLSAAGQVAPEFQVVSELTTAAYINLVQSMVGTGIGADQVTFSGTDVSSSYVNEVALPKTAFGVIDPDALMDRLNLLLFGGQLSTGLRQQIINSVNGVLPTATGPAVPPSKTKTITASDLAKANLNRAKLAITLSMVSGDYLVQR